MHTIRLRLNVGVPFVKRGFQYLCQYFLASTLNFRYGLIFLVINYLLGIFGPVVVVTSSDIFTLRLWKLALGTFIEPNAFLFVWSIISLHQFLTYIEPTWTLVEVLKYVGIVQLATIVSTAIFALLLFICCGALEFFFYSHICGFAAFGIAALVALKQFLPDTVVLTTPYGRLKNGHLPLCAFFIAVVFWLFSLMRGVVALQIALGIQISWTYLRFFKRATSEIVEGERGDDSEHFTWASFFPRRIQPLAGVVANGAFRLLIWLKICRQLKDLDLNTFETLQTALIPNAESRDAERKRQRALRMLNEHLTSVVSSGDKKAIGDNTTLPASSIEFGGDSIKSDRLLLDDQQMNPRIMLAIEGELPTVVGGAVGIAIPSTSVSTVHTSTMNEDEFKFFSATESISNEQWKDG